jgi:hypothetical protein
MVDTDAGARQAGSMDDMVQAVARQIVQARLIELRTERVISEQADGNVLLIRHPDSNTIQRAGLAPGIARQWDGFEFSMTGALVAAIPDIRSARPYWSFDSPVYGEQGALIVAAQMWEPNSPFRAEATWPASDMLLRDTAIRYVATDGSAFSNRQIARAGQALRILCDLRAIGQGKHAGDGASYRSDAAFLNALDEAIRHVQQSTSRANPDAQAVMRRLNLGKTAFYEYVKRATSKRWRAVAAEYELRRIPRNGGAVQSR